MVVKCKNLFSKALFLLSGFFFVSIFIYMNYIVSESFKAPVLKSLFLSFLFWGILYGLNLLFQMLEKKEKIFYAALAVLLFSSFLIRLYWINSVDTAQVSDFLRMWQSAGEIAKGDFSRFQKDHYLYTYPHLAFTTLLYSLVYKITGGSLYAMKFVNVLFSTVSCLLVYLIAGEMSKGKKAIAAFIMMMNVPFIFFNSVLDAQNIAIPFFYGAVLLYLKVFHHKISPLFMILVGFLLSVGNLFRGVGLIFSVAILMHLLIYGKELRGTKIFKSKRKKLQLSAVLIKPAVFILMIVAMQATTYLLNQVFLWSGVFQKPTWQTEGTLILYINAGFNHESNGMWNQADYDLLRDVDYDYQKAEIEAKRRLQERLSDKDKVMSLLSRKFRTQWGTGDFGGKYWSTLELASTSPSTNRMLVWLDYHFYFIQSFYSAMILSILYRLMKIYGKAGHEALYFGLIVFIGFVILYSLIEMQPRYGYIVMPMITALAGASIGKAEALSSD